MIQIFSLWIIFPSIFCNLIGRNTFEFITFSFAYWPFSIKLLWAPIVDSIFIGKFGRRKTWLVPVQYLIGATMFVLSKNVDFYLEVNVVTFIFPLSTAKHSFVITYAIQSPVTSKYGHQNFSRRLVISDGNN